MADEQTNTTTPADEDAVAEAAAGATGEAEEPIFVEDPAFEIDYKGECLYEVKVTIPVANERNQTDKMFDELKQGAEVPGFRKGKAPRKLLENKFSKIVRGEVEGKLVSAAFEKLVEDEKLRPIGQPKLDGLEPEKERGADEPLAFTMTFEVAPRIELGKYRGIEIERPVVHVNEKDIDGAVEEMRSRYAVFEKLDEGTAAEGDQIVIDFAGTIDGESFAGGSAKDYPYILGTRRFFPEFEEVLVGAAPGETKTCTVTFPEDYPNESIRGKKADFSIEIKGLKRRMVPELNDEFAKKAGFDSVNAMRSNVRERLSENSTATSDMIAQNRAVDAIIESATYEIPKSLIDDVAEDIYQERFRRQLGMRAPVAELEARAEELRRESREAAVHEIKRIVALNEIGEAEGVEVTDEDMEAEAGAMAARMGVGADVVSRHLMQEAEARSNVQSRIHRAKVMKLVMDNAVITDKEVPEDELTEESGGNADNAGADEA